MKYQQYNDAIYQMRQEILKRYSGICVSVDAKI